MNKRPRIPLKLTTSDYFIEIIAALGLISLIVLPIYFFKDLPDQIPNHYNTLGKVDSYGDREAIWQLPVIGLVFYIGLTVLNRFPFLFNYPVKVTNDNAEMLYTLGTRMIRLIKAGLILLLAFLNYKTIEIALNRASGMTTFFLPVFLAVLITLIGVMVIKMVRK